MKRVSVLAYHFPPFVYENGREGLTFDIIAMLNVIQQEYRFQVNLSSPKRRYGQLDGQRSEIMLFEMPRWGWQKHVKKIDISPILTIGKEVYIARKTNISLLKQDYFHKEVKNIRIAAIYGYHYGFTNFRTDDLYLAKNYNIMLVHRPRRVIDAVLKGRAAVGVITHSYLKQMMKYFPYLQDDIVVSDYADQQYELRALIHKNANISLNEFVRLMKLLSEKGLLSFLYNKYDLKDRLQK